MIDIVVIEVLVKSPADLLNRKADSTHDQPAPDPFHRLQFPCDIDETSAPAIMNAALAPMRISVNSQTPFPLASKLDLESMKSSAKQGGNRPGGKGHKPRMQVIA